jgi:hypothetical protein
VPSNLPPPGQPSLIQSPPCRSPLAAPATTGSGASGNLAAVAGSALKAADSGALSKTGSGAEALSKHHLDDKTIKKLAALSLLALAVKHAGDKHDSLESVATKAFAAAAISGYPSKPIVSAVPLEAKLPELAAKFPKVLPLEIPVLGPKDLLALKVELMKLWALASKKPELPKIEVPIIKKPKVVPVFKPLPSIKGKGWGYKGLLP